jgi:hypothetical protein
MAQPRSQHRRVPCQRAFQRFQPEDGGAFPDVEPAALHVERTARFGIERQQSTEPAQGERAQRIAAARQHGGGRAIQAHLRGQRDCHGARSTGHVDGAARAARAQRIAHRLGQGRHRVSSGAFQAAVPIPTSGVQHQPRFQFAQPRHRRSHDYAGIFRQVRAHRIPRR